MSNSIEIIEKDYLISPYARYLKKHGLYSVAIFYKNLNENLMLRTNRAIRYLFENAVMPKYNKNQVVFVNSEMSINQSIQENKICTIAFDGTCKMEKEKFLKLPCENEHEKEIKDIIIGNCEHMYAKVTSMRYYHTGMHHVVDLDFIIKNGFKGYKEKILKELQIANTTEKIQFCQAMLELVEAVSFYMDSYLKSLKQIENPDKNLIRLINAIEVVPMNAATNFYEAYISLNAAMYFSGCFEPGRIDKLLGDFYKNDDSIDREEAIYLFRELFSDIEKRTAHPGVTHVTVGGSKTDGTGDYNELTELCVIAIGGFRAPNMSLRVNYDMPEKLWDLFLENISKGYAQPAIVNEKIYIEGLVNQYDLPIGDAVNYVFGGCSELLVQGKCCSDSIWVAYNMLDVFEHTMYNELMHSNSYDEFYDKFKRDVDVSLDDMQEQNNIRQHTLGLNVPYPMRSLMTGGCIESGKSYSNGGTTYNFDATSIYGTTNTINSLYTIKKFYDGEFGDLSKENFLKCFVNNYKGYEGIYQKIKSITKYGNQNEEINDITADITSFTFNKIKSLRCYRGNGRYVPTIVLWITWIPCGKKVGATPDGRFSSEALADSSGPMQGTDIEGPTSVMGAALAIPQKDCVGTCVLNLRLDKNHFIGEENYQKVKQLIKAYFTAGGCQLQINVVDKETLLDALENPDKHRDLVVRVGGFSDNFVYLSDDIKQQVIIRTEH